MRACWHERSKAGETELQPARDVLRTGQVSPWWSGTTPGQKTLPLFLDRYNFRRPHGSLGKKAPAARLNNPVGSYK